MKHKPPASYKCITRSIWVSLALGSPAPFEAFHNEAAWVSASGASPSPRVSGASPSPPPSGGGEDR